MCFFGSTHAPDMTKSNTQTINDLYPTTNTPPLTTHHALIVCEAVRHVCPCDDDRDAKEDDCEDISMSDQFSDDISAEKTEAIDQCLGWIVFAVCGSYDRGSLG